MDASTVLNEQRALEASGWFDFTDITKDIGFKFRVKSRRLQSLRKDVKTAQDMLDEIKDILDDTLDFVKSL